MVANQAIDRLIIVTNKFSKGAKQKSIPSVKCLSDVQSLDTEVMKLLSETGQSWLSRELNNIYVREEDMSSAELQQHGKNAVAALLKRESLEQRYRTLLTPAVKKEASSVEKEEAEDSKGNVAKKSIGKSVVKFVYLYKKKIRISLISFEITLNCFKKQYSMCILFRKLNKLDS